MDTGMRCIYASTSTFVPILEVTGNEVDTYGQVSIPLAIRWQGLDDHHTASKEPDAPLNRSIKRSWSVLTLGHGKLDSTSSARRIIVAQNIKSRVHDASTWTLLERSWQPQTTTIHESVQPSLHGRAMYCREQTIKIIITTTSQ